MRSWLVVFIVVFAVFAPAVSAQDGDDLSEAEQALVDRFLQAMYAPDEYTSFVESGTLQMAVHMTIDQDDSQVEVFIRIEVQKDITKANPQNIATRMVVAYSLVVREDGDELQSESYLSVTDTRMIDGTLYLRAVSNMPDIHLPDGWVVGEDLLDYPELDPLSVGSLFDGTSFLGGISRSSFYGMVSDPTVKPDILEDGTTVDVITLSIPYAALAPRMHLDPASEALLTAGQSGFLSYAALIDASDFLRSARFHWKYSIHDGAVAELSLDSVLNGILEMNFEANYSQINEDLEPAVVPEEFIQ
jgi:hypothetical protein